MFHGRRLQAWLAGYDSAVGEARTAYRKEADEAIREAGTEAIPIALRMLQAREPKLGTWFRLRRLDLASRLHLINANTYAVQRMKLPAAWIERKSGAARVFEVLGDTAKDAVPALTTCMSRTSTPWFEARLAPTLRATLPAGPSGASVPSAQPPAAPSPRWFED